MMSPRTTDGVLAMVFMVPSPRLPVMALTSTHCAVMTSPFRTTLKAKRPVLLKKLSMFLDSISRSWFQKTRCSFLVRFCLGTDSSMEQPGTAMYVYTCTPLLGIVAAGFSWEVSERGRPVRKGRGLCALGSRRIFSVEESDIEHGTAVKGLGRVETSWLAAWWLLSPPHPSPGGLTRRLS